MSLERARYLSGDESKFFIALYAIVDFIVWDPNRSKALGEADQV